jgi:hypothetical protein
MGASQLRCSHTRIDISSKELWHASDGNRVKFCDGIFLVVNHCDVDAGLEVDRVNRVWCGKSRLYLDLDLLYLNRAPYNSYGRKTL